MMVLVRQLLYRNVQRFRGGLVFKAHRLLYHLTLGWRVIKKKKINLKVCPPRGLRARGGQGAERCDC